MSTATRRGFVAGALASVAAPALARAQASGAAIAPAKPLASRPPVRRGRAIAVSPKGDRVVVAHDRLRTIAITGKGRVTLVDVGGQPVNVAVAPGGRLVAVTTGFWDEKPGLAVVDVVAGTVRTRIDVGPAPFDVAFTRDGERIVVSGGEQEGTIHVIDADRLAIVASAPIGLVPRGVAVGPAADRAWVALNGLDRVVEVDLRSARVRRSFHTAPLPDRVAASPDGRRLLVTHGGDESVTEIDRRTGRSVRRRAGHQPSAVAWTATGRRLVALGGSGEIVVLRPGRAPRAVKTGGAPRGLAVAGRRAFTVDALTGKVARVTV